MVGDEHGAPGDRLDRRRGPLRHREGRVGPERGPDPARRQPPDPHRSARGAERASRSPRCEARAVEPGPLRGRAAQHPRRGRWHAPSSRTRCARPAGVEAASQPGGRRATCAAGGAPRRSDARTSARRRVRSGRPPLGGADGPADARRRRGRGRDRDEAPRREDRSAVHAGRRAMGLPSSRRPRSGRSRRIPPCGSRTRPRC